MRCWQPLPDGPVITIPSGSTNVPVTSVAGFAVGQKIALGYGTSYPAVANSLEHYEVTAVTAIGKPGVQAYLAADARADATNIKVTAVENISVGDKIRLDIDSVGHGIETVTVSKVGDFSPAVQRWFQDVASGATNIKVRSVKGFATGDKINIGTPANRETVSITSVGEAGAGRYRHQLHSRPRPSTRSRTRRYYARNGASILAAPLKFDHAAIALQQSRNRHQHSSLPQSSLIQVTSPYKGSGRASRSTNR